MKSKTSFLLAALLSLLLLIGPIEAQELWIEVMPLSAEMRKLPVKIYWKESETCPPEFNKVLKKTLDVALILLRKSIWRFMEENDGKYDDFIAFRLEYTDNPQEAQIIVTGDQLEEGVAGETWVGMVDGELVPPAEIYYDCEVVLKPLVPAFNVVLHELLHGLGLGHAYFDKVGDQWEIMAEVRREGEPTIYVSTLDLHALYQIWFKRSHRDTVALPSSLEFKEVKPYVVELEELKEIYEDLHEKYGVLESEVNSLKGDLKTLKERVYTLEENVTQISTEVSALESEVGDLNKGLSSVETTVSILGEGLRKASEDIEAVNSSLKATAKNLNNQITQVALNLRELTTKVLKNEEALEAQQQQILTINTSIQELNKRIFILMILTTIAICLTTITIAVITLRRRG